MARLPERRPSSNFRRILPDGVASLLGGADGVHSSFGTSRAARPRRRSSVTDLHLSTSPGNAVQAIEIRQQSGSSSGFTVMELLLVLAIVGTLAAIAVPSLLRARMSVNEVAAVGAIRSIITAQTSYAAGCGAGYFAPTLARLASPPAGGGDGYIGRDLATDPVIKSSYTI